MAVYNPIPGGNIGSKEDRQQRNYVMLSELQKMAREVPHNLQQRLPYSLLSALANSLLDGTVFEIVLHLQEIQQMTERKLMEQRANLHKSHKAQRVEMQRRHQEVIQACHVRPHNLPLVKKKNEEEHQALEKKLQAEVPRMDERIVMELDTCVSDQQVTLEKAGVPGFYKTNNPIDVRLQMYLLEFIGRLNAMNLTSGT